MKDPGHGAAAAMPDLATPDEIARLVRTFYDSVAVDDLLGPVFVGQANVDWKEHLPRLTGFWCQLELGITGYSFQPTQKHTELSNAIPFRAEQFQRWVDLFHRTIDAGWRGPHADSMKARAVAIAKAQSMAVPSAEAWTPSPPASPTTYSPQLPAPGPPPERVLIVRMSHLGDVAQALPLVHGVRALWPDAEIGWAIQAEFAPLVEPFARIFPFDRRGGVKAWPRIRAAMRAWGPDLAIDAQGNWKSAVCTRLSGASRRYGFERDAWQEPLAARVAGLEHAAALPVPGGPAMATQHLVARCHSIAAHLGVDAPHTLPMDPLLTTDEKARGRTLLADAMGDESDAPITVLHPGVPGDPRTWPEACFGELGRRLIRQGRRVLFLTGPGEAASGEALRATLPDATHWVGQRGLRDLCSVLHAVAQDGGELFVSDSGPAHVAASVGLPVRLLAGPEDPQRTGPWPTVTSERSPHRLVPRGGSAGPGWSEAPWSQSAIESVTVDAAEAASDETQATAYGP